MKKYMLFGTLIAIMPNYVFGASARYNQLVAEKQQKMAELEKCSGDVNGWKIAGISTIGLTAVGVAGNIVLANKQSDYDNKIANTNKEIDNTRNRIEQKERENAEKAAARERICRESGGTYLNGQCYCGADKVLNAEGRCQTVPQSTAPVQPVATPTQETKCIVNGTEYIDNNVYNVSAYQCSVFNNTLDLLNVRSCDCVCHDNVMNCTVATCFDKYKLENNKCVLEQQNNVSADCTSEAKAKDANVTKATMNNGKCEVTECVGTHKVKADKTGCEVKQDKKEPVKPTVVKKECTIGNQSYRDGWNGSLICSRLPNKSDFPNANSCICKCTDGKFDCKIETCIDRDKFKLINGKCEKQKIVQQCDVNKNGIGKGTNEYNQTWNVVFDYGEIKGKSLCSSTNVTSFTTGTPSSEGGRNCWCQVTQFIPNTNNECKIKTPSEWMRHSAWAQETECKRKCPETCAYAVKEHQKSRKVLMQ